MLNRQRPDYLRLVEPEEEPAPRPRVAAPPEVDYYYILQVRPWADARALSKAYWRLAYKYANEVGRDPEASSNLALLNEAYYVLTDPEQRAEYDERFFPPELLETIRVGRMGHPMRMRSERTRPAALFLILLFVLLVALALGAAVVIAAHQAEVHNAVSG